MSTPIVRSITAAAAFTAMVATVPTLAQAEDAGRTLADNEAIFIDGKTLTVTPGRPKGDVVSQVRGLNAHALGPGAIVFRSGNKLYVIEGAPMDDAMAMYDPHPGADRQRSYGGLYDPYPSSDYRNDRQRSYGGLYDPYPSSDFYNDRQRSYGGLYDPYPSSDFYNDRQRSYGGLYDPYPSSDYRNDRQRSYGGLYDPYPSSDYRNDRQRSYGGLYDPDYANYRLKKAFQEVWGANGKS